MLLLDEPTANVDVATDALIQQTLRSKFAKCTVITVAHRLRTVVDCDRVLVLAHGQVMEYAHPHVLLSDHDSHFSGMAAATGERNTRELAIKAEEAYLTTRFK